MNSCCTPLKDLSCCFSARRGRCLGFVAYDDVKGIPSRAPVASGAYGEEFGFRACARETGASLVAEMLGARARERVREGRW